NTPILLMVSGGSAFQFLDFVERGVLGPHLTLTILDERFSTDPLVNNFAQLEQTSFYERCMERGVKTIVTKVVEGEDLYGLSERFQRALLLWKKEHPNGIVIATMGIGSDGHTAGIFPSESGARFTTEVWVLGYTVPKSVPEHSERITVTHTFLKEEVEEAIVYAVGPEKAALVERLENDGCDFFVFPACVFHHMRRVTLFSAIGDGVRN
ncbi:MAG: 6-phosphogluconolactonase, partial [Candidatus Paceibacterota bacterium]